MFSEGEKVFSEYVLECGFYTWNYQGLFSKSVGRTGIFDPRPLDPIWTDQI
jgi:hypothetical protein